MRTPIRAGAALAAVGAALLTGYQAEARQIAAVRPQARATATPALVLATHTNLKTCVHAAGCPPSFPGLVTYLPLDTTQSLRREFTWATDARGATHGRWQVARQAFPPAATTVPAGLIGEGDAGAAPGGKFWVDLRHLTGPAAGAAPTLRLQPRAQPAQSAGALLAPGVYYVRVVTLAGSAIVGSPSNTVTIRVSATPGTSQPGYTLVTFPTDVYTVSVVSFDPIKPAALPWGCVDVISVDPSAASPLYQRWRDAAASHAPVCPAAFKGVGEPSWYESFWDFVTSGADWVSGVYADIKRTVVSTVVAGINLLPGHLCNATCAGALSAGLDAGLVALGIPPEIPSLQALTDQGLDYLVSVAASEAGIPCDGDCVAEIRKGTRAMAAQIEQQTLIQACSNVELAHRHGAEPLCVPPGVTARPAEASSDTPARMVIRVTRKPGTGNVAADILARYRLSLVFDAVNTVSGNRTWSVPTNTCWNDNSAWPCDEQKVTVAGPLRGPLFAAVEGPMPRLDPGQSVQIPFWLTLVPYWLPGHQELIRKAGGFVHYNDWQYLYLGASVTGTAAVVCPRTTGPDPVPCSAPAKTTLTMPGKAR